jgi:cytochrome P450
MVSDQLPAGPKLPAAVQTLGYWTRPTAFLEGARRRYGSRFTLRLIGQDPIVMISDPQEIRELMTAPPDVLHPGEGGKVIEPVVGPTSVIVLDEERHLRQRKLMLPPFHGEALQRLSALIDEFCEREVSSWPVGEPVALHPRLQRVTLEIILRVVFGLEEGRQLDAVRDALAALLGTGTRPLELLWTLPAMAWTGPARRRVRQQEVADRLIFELVEHRRRGGEQGDDVLSLLLAARHEDGSPLSELELRDELVTMLVAGHETTASQLAWAVAILARMPDLTGALGDEIDRGASDALLKATIREIMRLRPVLPNAEPRVVNKPVQIGPTLYPVGTALYPSTYLLHHDPQIYPDPYRFRPERFMEQPPGTYTWLPFGAGRRRCIGASFAMVEMQSLLRAALANFSLAPTGPPMEGVARRGITITPRRQATVVLRSRSSPRAAAEPAAMPAAA